MRVGVLAVQGGVSAHLRMLEALGHEASEVRVSADLGDLEGLVLPGGESTTQWSLLRHSGLDEALHRWRTTGESARARARSSRTVLATCAGLILAAHHLNWLDVRVDRNAWGSQLDSFEATSDAGEALVFIRAPRIIEVSPSVTVGDRLAGEPVVVEQNRVVGCCFHPELSGSTHWHRRCFGDT